MPKGDLVPTNEWHELRTKMATWNHHFPGVALWGYEDFPKVVNDHEDYTLESIGGRDFISFYDRRWEQRSSEGAKWQPHGSGLGFGFGGGGFYDHTGAGASRNVKPGVYLLKGSEEHGKGSWRQDWIAILYWFGGPFAAEIYVDVSEADEGSPSMEIYNASDFCIFGRHEAQGYWMAPAWNRKTDSLNWFTIPKVLF